MQKENTIPTVYASLSLLFCSLLLWVISFAKKKEGDKDFLFWLGLAIIFLYLSIDEVVAIHERFNGPVRSVLHTTGYLYYAWVIPYGIFVIFFGLTYLKFVISLPQKTRLLFIIAGLIYVAGAIGLELLESSQRVYGKNHNAQFVAFITTIEEVLEMAGAAVFIYALLSYISSELKHLQLRILFTDVDNKV